jgi:uncharacterized protein (TIGR02611 family)
MTGIFRRCRETYNHPSLTLVRRIIASVVGGTVLLIGVSLIILPGPAFLVIPLGLAILATEFVWARHLLHKAKGMLKRKKTTAPARPVEVVSDR